MPGTASFHLLGQQLGDALGALITRRTAEMKDTVRRDRYPLSAFILELCGKGINISAPGQSTAMFDMKGSDQLVHATRGGGGSGSL